MPNPSLLRALARSFLAGEQTVEGVTARGSRTLGKRSSWLLSLARRYVVAFAGMTRHRSRPGSKSSATPHPKPRPRLRDVLAFLLQDQGFAEACHKQEISVAHWLAEPQQMQPVPAAKAWGVPAIETAGALADWLALTLGDLQWFADLKRLGYRRSSSPQVRHYYYRILVKDSGNIRLIEAPKQRLNELQRHVLAGILEKIPPHRAAHGFLKGRSIKTFVAPHVGRRVVLRMDLRDFFPSFAGSRIQALFRTMGYPEAVADLLGGICTNATPRDVWRHDLWQRGAPGIDSRRMCETWGEARSFYARPHLPQGAPTSPALANLCCYRMDCRLTGLSKSAGAEYTRYADDLAFSGGEAFERRVDRFSIHVAAILSEEGFSVHHRKTRVMCQGVRQHLAGLVVNQRMNVRRTDFDLLKAILTNCVRQGPKSQNRDAHPRFRAHLDGRVGFVEMINPSRGKRLRTIFERIQWE